MVAALAHAPRIYEFAAASADLVFITPTDDASLDSILDEVKAAGGQHLKVYADVVVTFGGDTEFGSDALIFDGSPADVVDLLLGWQQRGIDGARLRPAVNATDLPVIVDDVVPLLQRAKRVSHRLHATARRCVNDSVCRIAPNRYARRMKHDDRVPLSILDLSPISAGSDAATALHNTIDLAQRAEQWGYRRFWIAEHHFVGVASSAPAVLIGQIAAATNTIQVGSAAVQLGHTTAAAVVESFGMLDAFYPGRIDLGARPRATARHRVQAEAAVGQGPPAAAVARSRWRGDPAAVRPARAARHRSGAGDDGRSCSSPRRWRPTSPINSRDILAMLDGTYEVGGFDVHAVPGERSGLSAVDLWQHSRPECAAGRRARPAVRRELPHHPGDRAGSHRGLPRHVRPVGNAAAALRRGVR